MNEFTKGEWSVKDGHYPSMIDIKIGECMTIPVVLSATNLSFEQGLERQANALLIATAGTTATKLAEDGYNAVKVLEVLPEIMQHIEQCATSSAHNLFKQCRGE